ncbi:MAG: helix-turn-helix transcriptional regulator [Peptoniphilus harei]|nr:helix-turn-helix transcriptional regulator [Peptoniphilus harei]
MEKLKEIRENAGLTARELSRLIGVKEGRYGHYENGRRELPVNIAKKIGKVLEINWWEIYE